VFLNVHTLATPGDERPRNGAVRVASSDSERAATGHPAVIPVDRLLRECEISVTRRSGPGGQHRNKVETAVIIRHCPSGVSAEASERRSRAENRQVAIERLRLRLALALRMPPDGRGPSPLWRLRTRGKRLIVAVDHRDFPALVAEALDRLAAADWQVAAAAPLLGVTTSQLIGLFRKAPAAWVAVNEARARHGLPPLA
jgi:hypothetical protein